MKFLNKYVNYFAPIINHDKGVVNYVRTILSKIRSTKFRYSFFIVLTSVMDFRFIEASIASEALFTFIQIAQSPSTIFRLVPQRDK